MVLCLLPLWFATLVGGLPFIAGLLFGDVIQNGASVVQWEVRLLTVSLFLLLLHEVLLWSGPLGVVNREVMRTTQHRKLRAVFGLRWLTLRWSFALWHGLLLGALDTVLKRNGH